MEESLFYDIISQLKNLSYKGILSLYEINEPLTDKRLLDFLIYARLNLPQAWIFITTNGDLLTEEKTRYFFKAGLNFIFLNSYDREALTRNHELLSKLGEAYASSINHIDRTYQTSWTSRAGNVRLFHKGACIAPCDQVYEVMYIKPTGMVYSCINDFYNVNEMGDLNKQTILEVWFGEAFKNLRRNLDLGRRDFSRLCKHCDYKGYSNLPKVPISWKVKHFPGRRT
jgi:radical SAM protein with 4Fe4S-binding SPASM domain